MYRPILALMFLAGVVFGQFTPTPNIVTLCNSAPAKIGSHFVRAPGNCSNMYNCDGDLSFPRMLTCGNRLHFSLSQQVCVRIGSEYDDCRRNNIRPGQYRDPLCMNKMGVNRDPGNCRRFIPCWNGNSFPSMRCQGNLEFKFSEQRCVQPRSGDCPRNNQG